MELMIEVQGRNRHGARQFRVDGDQVRIGRAYDNDVVVADPYVDPYHAVLRPTADGGIEVVDLDSLNGVHDHRHRRLTAPSPLAFGDPLIIGQSQLRVYDRTRAVAPALPLRPLDNLLRYVGRPAVVVSLLVLMMAMVFAVDYLTTPVEFKALASLRTSLGSLLGACLWALVWVLVARLTRHEGRFLQQLALTVVFFSVAPVVTLLLQVVSFNLSAPTLEHVLVWLVWGLVMWWLLNLNLYAALVQTASRRRVTATLITAALLGVSVTVELEDNDFSPAPRYDASIMPPALNWTTGETPQAFLDSAAWVFDTDTADD